MPAAVLGVCWAHSACANLPVALWRTYADSYGVKLCEDHLNLWLDLADNDEAPEPAELIWLANQKAVA